MLFNSIEFVFGFLPLVFLGYFSLNYNNKIVAGKVWLALSSFFFYGWWNPSYLPLIIFSIVFNYLLGKKLGEEQGWQWRWVSLSNRLLLVLGLVFNLGLLGYFKYFNFFVSNISQFMGLDMGPIAIILPLGISFFTFTQIAYLVDCYREGTKEYNFVNYALFVTFFPHLIAGPILHHKEMMPQFADLSNLGKHYAPILSGLFLFSVGLFKKVVVADTFALWADPGFDHAMSLGFYEAWATSLSYTFQLYYDFSGYTDMAIGAALLFNIRLPINFNSPYKALTIQDFWRRWHMTLSRFLKDYLYIPLGGNRHGVSRMYLNIMATFALGGLWHGASWMFVIWGVMHGAAMVLHRLWSKLGFRLPILMAWLLTFNFINLTWVFFRARDLDSAFAIIGAMVGLDSAHSTKGKSFALPEGLSLLSGYPAGYVVGACILAALFCVVAFRNSNQRIYFERTEALLKNTYVIGYAMLALVAIYMTMATPYNKFIYFNF